jgi:hypothetical protein
VQNAQHFFFPPYAYLKSTIIIMLKRLTGFSAKNLCEAKKTKPNLSAAGGA